MNRTIKIGIIALALILAAWAAVANGQTVLFPGGGGTGTSTAPAKGSVLAGFSATRYGVLAVGANGTCLMASSTASFGVSWETCAATSVASLNSLTGALTTASGSAGTDFNIQSSGTTITWNFPSASGSNRGLLTSTDWTTFNSKVSTSRSINTTVPLGGGGDLSADRTLTVGGLSASGTQNYIVGVKSGGASWEYKQLIEGTGITITHSGASVTVASAGGSTVDVTYTANEDLTIGNTVGASLTADRVVKAFKAEFGTEATAESSATVQTVVAQLDTDKFVIGYIDGTNIAARAATVSAGTVAFGDETVAKVSNGDTLDVCQIATDSFTMIYSTVNRTRYGIVGGVSGTAITFGTEADYGDFPSAQTRLVKCAKLDTDKFIALAGASDKVINVWANTVDGSDAITKGSDVTIGAGVTAATAAAQFHASLAQIGTDKAMVVYRKASDLDGYANILTVVSTTVSSGTEAEFNNADTSEMDVDCPSTSSCVVTYADEGNTSQGTIVGINALGTAPSFSSEVVFNNATTSYTSAASLSDEKVLVAFQDGGDSSQGKLVSVRLANNAPLSVGAVVPETTFNSTSTLYVSIAKTAGGKFVLGYRDAGNSNAGTALVGIPVGYLGIAQSTVSAAASVSVRLTGVDSNQSGLLTGVTYYASNGGVTTDSGAGAEALVGAAKSATSILTR